VISSNDYRRELMPALDHEVAGSPPDDTITGRRRESGKRLSAATGTNTGQPVRTGTFNGG